MIIKINSLKKKLIIILALILILVQVKINPVFAMEHTQIVQEVGKAINENNIIQAERLLEILRTHELTRDQILNITNIINQIIGGPNGEYQVHDLNIQNSGMPAPEENRTNNILISLGMAIGITFAVWLAFKYWNEIRDILFDVGRSTVSVTTQLLRTTMLERFQLVRNNPQALYDIQSYLNSLDAPHEAA